MILFYFLKSNDRKTTACTHEVLIFVSSRKSKFDGSTELFLYLLPFQVYYRLESSHTDFGHGFFVCVCDFCQGIASSEKN